ncbi:hypothetical protein ACP6JC_001236 [Aspergillus fumigatus]
MARRHLKSRADTASNSTAPQVDVGAIVKGVIDDIRANGDTAVRKYSERFDKWSPASFRLSREEIEASIAACPPQTIEDIEQVQRNVRAFAKAQRDSIKDFDYIPGGRYPLLASAHMTILTAKEAGVPKVIGCTPPIAGKIPHATIAAMHLAGADEIYVLGGVQAIAAMALGTETMDKVDFIAGPGNAFVAEAKRQLFGEIGIDLFAGPTEILIVADETANPFTVATDILSQAEHGPDSPAVIITTSEAVGRESMRIITELLKNLSTAELAGTSWERFGEVIVVDSIDEAWKLADEYASEHVQILTKEPRQALRNMNAYGALFLGEKTCVSYGDKVIGTNHVLPTKKAARFTGGLWVGKYLRTVTYQEVTSRQASGELGRLCGRAARAENFEGHARSGDLRAYNYLGDQFEWIQRDI